MGRVGLVTIVMVAGMSAMGCGEAVPAPTSDAEDPWAGRVIEFDGRRNALDWGLDTTLVFGGEPSGPGGFYQMHRVLVDVDSLGQIYVLDRSQYRVAVFDPTGTVIGVYGREGDGPGELRFPVSVAAVDGDVVAVYDANKGALVRFTLSDSSSTQVFYPHSVINVGLRHVEFTTSGQAYWARDPRSARVEETHKDRLRLIQGGDTADLVPAYPSPLTTAEYPECGMRFTIPQPLSPFPRWAQWGDRIVASAYPGYRVDVFEGARQVWSLRGSGLPPALNAAQTVDLLEARGFRGGPCRSTAREVIESHGFAKDPQLVQEVALEPSGRLWVEFFGANQQRWIDLFGPSGDYLGSLPSEFPMPLTFLPDGGILLGVTDSTAVERLGIARLTSHQVGSRSAALPAPPNPLGGSGSVGGQP